MFEGRHRVAFGPLRVTARPTRLWKFWTSRLVALSAMALNSGCAVGPDFAPPPAPDVSGYTRGQTPTQTVSAGTPGGEAQRLLRVFASGAPNLYLAREAKIALERLPAKGH